MVSSDDGRAPGDSLMFGRSTSKSPFPRLIARFGLPIVAGIPSARLIGILALSLFLSTYGLWWGLPNLPESWAPDEFNPLGVFEAAGRRFSQGWFDLYPPMHFHVVTLVQLPASPCGHARRRVLRTLRLTAPTGFRPHHASSEPDGSRRSARTMTGEPNRPRRPAVSPSPSSAWLSPRHVRNR